MQLQKIAFLHCVLFLSSGASWQANAADKDDVQLIQSSLRFTSPPSTSHVSQHGWRPDTASPPALPQLTKFQHRARRSDEAPTRAEQKSLASTSWSGTEKDIRAKSSLQLQFKTQSAPQSQDQTFDISINAFKRDRLLDSSLQNYIKCHRQHGGRSALSHIWVIWNDNSRQIPDFLKSHEGTGIVTFFRPTGNDRISNRFLPLNFTSNAVFHVDDDMQHMCPTLDDMFEIWRTDNDGMVGTSPRKLDLLEGGIDCWACPIIWGEYNIVFLTKGAFVHKRFFQEYWKPFWKPIRDLIDEHNCGEDVLMSAVHASIVGSGKVYSIAGSVNTGEWMAKELTDKVEEFSGLNSRTWDVRGFAIQNISNFLKTHFSKEAALGYFSNHTKQWWRSNVNSDQSCRSQSVACYNRAWDVCSKECEVQVRGTMACFTGDSACYAGSHAGTPFYGENDMIVCVGENCSM